MAASSVKEIMKAQRADGPATILAIGTANPPNEMHQAEFPDFYFRVTDNDHKLDLKHKFKHICEKSMIKKRYMILTQEMLRDNPNICDLNASSLNNRQDILIKEVPKLGKEAAMKAVKEWGQPTSRITHVIFCTTSGIDLPGADYRLVKLLGLDLSVRRLMLYQQGCFGAGTAVRLAKDVAENNRGSRVLAVSCESNLVFFNGPREDRVDNLVSHAIFGDGAAALIVGADPDEPPLEQPLFQLVSAAQTILPDSEAALAGQLRQVGLDFSLSKDIPGLISNNVEKILTEAFRPIGVVSDWNSIFWVVYAGGRRVLDEVEAKLELEEGKLSATRHVLREYGNMSSATVLFVLEEMRKRSLMGAKSTTGEGLDWGVLIGFGPGLTVETVVLHSVPIIH